MNTVPLRTNLSAMLASTRMRLLNVTRYPGQIIMDVIVPIVLAAMPILLGRATAGDQAAVIFEANTGTSNYVGYMIIGASAFSMVSYAFWHIAYWIRWEMETGTLESLYLSPTASLWIAAGTSLYSLIRSLVAALTSYFLGSLILGVNPLQGELLLAVSFLVVGAIPLYGMALLFGAVVLKLRDANSLINLMQWVVSFLMGVFFPIQIFPAYLKVIALLFPPTWMTNGVRSALLGVGYFFGEWYFDLAMLWVFLLIAPLVGYQIFMRVENGIRRNEGVGQY
ncbi:MAG TPA: ABC transporter permease [Anaerolineales bacterium]|nr:ABC transporter permease [Anaerolineales bacterium]